MATYKTTFGFRAFGFTASESYFLEADSLVGAGDKVQLLLNARLNLIMPVVEVVNVRIGLAEDLPPVPGTKKRRSRPFKPGVYTEAQAGVNLTVDTNGKFRSLNVGPGLEQTRDCLTCTQVFDTDRSVVRYLAFPPNTISKPGFPDVPDLGRDPVFNVNFAFFSSLVQTTSKVRARSRAVGFEQIPIVGWRASSDETPVMGFVINVPPGPTYLQGDQVQIQGVRRKGTDKTSYNGRYIVSGTASGPETGQQTVWLRGTTAGNPNSIKLLGTAQKIGHQYYSPTKFYATMLGEHRRGNSYGSRRGRRLTRVSLDP